ncbi:predicted protein [Lichtheimia corymbifera JMRC:FSU:9682]|uniref:Uncharacterized protein n=1 Tax=Lichtheimia corymbifera JMRC:FSU:9682 TaxID=1263082 RepID=A0A068S8W8_9FUNG|nr:predicted protein [Lichtheimia corymbifera JMRC:FSU:9682]
MHCRPFFFYLYIVRSNVSTKPIHITSFFRNDSTFIRTFWILSTFGVMATAYLSLLRPYAVILQESVCILAKSFNSSWILSAFGVMATVYLSLRRIDCPLLWQHGRDPEEVDEFLLVLLFRPASYRCINTFLYQYYSQLNHSS